VGVDSRSASFDGTQQWRTALAVWGKARSICEMVVVRLATDYCVTCTVPDAFEVNLRCEVPEGSRTVDTTVDDGR